MAAFLP
ncbi:hypothetical protein YPPY94_1880, partial [Yersinia pestis PY-94]